MSGVPQKLSKGQKEEVIKLLKNKIISWGLIFLALFTSFTGYGIYQIKCKLENKLEIQMKLLVMKQFEEPKIKKTVQDVADNKANSLLLEYVNPEIENFKNEISSRIIKLKSLIEETQRLKTEINTNAQKIEDVLLSVQLSQKEVEEIKKSFIGLHSNIIKLEKYLIEMQYFTHKGRNQFPNPYQKKIIDSLNKLLKIAIPNINERAIFIKELESYKL